MVIFIPHKEQKNITYGTFPLRKHANCSMHMDLAGRTIIIIITLYVLLEFGGSLTQMKLALPPCDFNGLRLFMVQSERWYVEC